MSSTQAIEGDALLYGIDPEPSLVAVEHRPDAAADTVELFFRREGAVVREHGRFEPFALARADLLSACPVPARLTRLAGNGELNACAVYPTWKAFLKARSWLTKTSGVPASAARAPYLCPNDPVHQYLLRSGRTLFNGMTFEDLRRAQVDIECVTSEGYEFCNPEREGDRIVAIAIGCGDEIEVLSGAAMDEAELLQRFVDSIQAIDPDVIEGHNIFNFDLRYLSERARRHGIQLALGRDASEPHRRSSRFSSGERVVAYERFDIHGRHVIDTLFLCHAYDVTHRSLTGYGLKEVAAHFGLSPRNRTLVEGPDITAVFNKDPERIMRYVRDDITETRRLAELLARSPFLQTQMLPYSYQNAAVRGSAARIDALMLREYVRAGHAVPLPDEPRSFPGGYTDIFSEGVIENVHHCDIRSLYPSLMLLHKLQPSRDELGVFLRLLERLRTIRLAAKESMARAGSDGERLHFDALQTTFKVLINSFYGYLGFGQAQFSDFGAAEAVTREGRDLLKRLIAWMTRHGARPVEIDTDGVYFVPPPNATGETQAARAALEAFQTGLASSLPPGIEIEFDGAYRSMFSYKMKNYALLGHDGEMTIKGAALKSRGLEPFQREFMREAIRLMLEGRAAEIGKLKTTYAQAIANRSWPIQRLAKTERLQDSPAAYAAKRQKSKRARSAAYELALASEREYRAGDQVSYYVTGTRKSVTLAENAKLVSESRPDVRDENIAYYLAKLESLAGKFQPGPAATGTKKKRKGTE